MKNKELIERIDVEINLRFPTYITLQDCKKALQDAEEELEIRIQRDLKQVEEINRLKSDLETANEVINSLNEDSQKFYKESDELKANLSEQVDPIEFAEWYKIKQFPLGWDNEQILEQFKKERE